VCKDPHAVRSGVYGLWKDFKEEKNRFPEFTKERRTMVYTFVFVTRVKPLDSALNVDTC
jgi:hypothetical protein